MSGRDRGQMKGEGRTAITAIVKIDLCSFCRIFRDYDGIVISSAVAGSVQRPESTHIVDAEVSRK